MDKYRISIDRSFKQTATIDVVSRDCPAAGSAGSLASEMNPEELIEAHGAEWRDTAMHTSIDVCRVIDEEPQP